MNKYLMASKLSQHAPEDSLKVADIILQHLSQLMIRSPYLTLGSGLGWDSLGLASEYSNTDVILFSFSVCFW